MLTTVACELDCVCECECGCPVCVTRTVRLCAPYTNDHGACVCVRVCTHTHVIVYVHRKACM